MVGRQVNTYFTGHKFVSIQFNVYSYLTLRIEYSYFSHHGPERLSSIV